MLGGIVSFCLILDDQHHPTETQMRWWSVNQFLNKNFTPEQIEKGGILMRYQAYALMYGTKPIALDRRVAPGPEPEPGLEPVHPWWAPGL